ELRHRDMIVNSKKVRRLMREHDLQPKRRRRFMATTDSDDDNPIFPDLARDRVVDGPNQLWVADITYIAIAAGFVYLAAILDAWSRRVVGYAISRSIDARLAIAALKAAIRARQPLRAFRLLRLSTRWTTATARQSPNLSPQTPGLHVTGATVRGGANGASHGRKNAPEGHLMRGGRIDLIRGGQIVLMPLATDALDCGAEALG